VTAPATHRAGRATYNGPVDNIVGELRGPTTYGAMLVATEQTYDEASDTTVIEFAHTVPASS
jgi:hypothetical protein